MSGQYSCEFCSNYVYDEEYEEYEDDEEEEEEPRSTFSFFKKKEPEVEEESSNSKISQPFDNTITASREAKKRRFTSTGRRSYL